MTFPRKDDNVIVSPVRPFDPTTGNVKSGREFGWESEAVEVYVLDEMDDG